MRLRLFREYIMTNTIKILDFNNFGCELQNQFSFLVSLVLSDALRGVHLQLGTSLYALHGNL